MSLGLRQASRRTDRDAGMLALINIVLLLLILFMLIGRLSPPEQVTVEPPHSRSAADRAHEGIHVLITADGTVALSGSVLSPDGLIARVKQRIAEDPQPAVTVKADARADSQLVVRLLRRLDATGARRIELVTVARP